MASPAVWTDTIAGRGTPDQAPAHRLMRDDPEAFTRIIDLVTEATIAYLARQIAAGAVRMFARHEMLDVIVVEGRAVGIVTRDLVFAPPGG